jgi:ubiquinone biosynthesis protein Coq4
MAPETAHLFGHALTLGEIALWAAVVANLLIAAAVGLLAVALLARRARDKETP